MFYKGGRWCIWRKWESWEFFPMQRACESVPKVKDVTINWDFTGSLFWWLTRVTSVWVDTIEYISGQSWKISTTQNKKMLHHKGPRNCNEFSSTLWLQLLKKGYLWRTKCWRFFQIRLVCLNRILTRISVDHNILQLLSMPFKRSVSKLLLFHRNFLFFYSSLSQWMTLITCLKGLCYCSGCVSQHGIYVSHSEREGRI